MYNEAKNHQTEGFGLNGDEQSPKRKKVDLFDLVGERLSNETQTYPSFLQNAVPKDLPNFSLTSYLSDTSLETVNLKTPTSFFEEVIHISDDEKQKASPIPLNKPTDYEKDVSSSTRTTGPFGREDSPLMKKILESPTLPTPKKSLGLDLDRLELQFQNFGKVFKKSPDKNIPTNQNYFPQQQQQQQPIPQNQNFYQKPNFTQQPQQNVYPPVYNQRPTQQQQPQGGMYQNVYQNSYDRNMGQYYPQPNYNNYQQQRMTQNGSPFMPRYYNGYPQKEQYLPQYENYSSKSNGMFKQQHYLGNYDKRIGEIDLLEFSRERNDFTERIEPEEKKKKVTEKKPKKKAAKKKPQKKKKKEEVEKVEEPEEVEEEPEEILVLSDNFIFSNQSLDMFSEAVDKIEKFSTKMKNEIISRLEINEDNQEEVIEKLMSDPMIELSLYNSVLKEKSFKGIDIYELINSSNLNLVPKKVIEKKKQNSFYQEEDESPPRKEKKKTSVPVARPSLARVFNNSVIRSLEKKEIDQDFFLIFDSVSSRRSQRLALRDPVPEEKKNVTSEDEEFTLKRKPSRKRKKEKNYNDGNYEE